jgi:hypothetical protein
MIHQYLIGAYCHGLTEPEFLDRLATIIKNSSDMLAQVYGACNIDDYRSPGNEIMLVYEQHNPQEYDEEEDHRNAPETNPNKFEMAPGRTFSNAPPRHRTNIRLMMGRAGSYARGGRWNTGMGHSGLEKYWPNEDHEDHLDLR